VPSYTFIATAHALQWQEITPIFADIDPATHNLDPVAVRRMITPRTTGIVGVHLWGRGAPVEELEAIAGEYKLRLMFDASHGFGCTLNGKSLGGFGQCEVFSFHATKFFNTFEGGAVVTNNDDLAEKMRLMRNFGFHDYDNVIYPGTNGKMTEISAAMGLTNLESIDDFVAHNRRNYTLYREGLGQVRGLSPRVHESERNNFSTLSSRSAPNFRPARPESWRPCRERAGARFGPAATICSRIVPHPNAGLVLPNTNAVAARRVLPTGSAIGEADIDGICAVIRHWPPAERISPARTAGRCWSTSRDIAAPAQHPSNIP
jgi:dTDP-4-amino-4,6-dideoxygalactose transaminase